MFNRHKLEDVMSNGTVVAIFTTSQAGAPMQSRREVQALASLGLQADRYATGVGSFNKKTGIGNRQVTMMNTRFFDGTHFTYDQSRRNIFVKNIELMRLIGKEFKIGAATFRGIKYCYPCVRPSKLAGKSSLSLFEEEFEDCGGLIAEVIEGGLIKINDSVVSPSKGD